MTISIYGEWSNIYKFCFLKKILKTTHLGKDKPKITTFSTWFVFKANVNHKSSLEINWPQKGGTKQLINKAFMPNTLLTTWFINHHRKWVVQNWLIKLSCRILCYYSITTPWSPMSHISRQVTCSMACQDNVPCEEWQLTVK